MPKDRVTNLHQGYGFVEFRSEEDADYVSLYIYLLRPLEIIDFYDDTMLLELEILCTDIFILFLGQLCRLSRFLI